MSTNSKAIQVARQNGPIGNDTDTEKHADFTNERGVFSKTRHLIGKIVMIDNDWIFKSKDWPYMWPKK